MGRRISDPINEQLSFLDPVEMAKGVPITSRTQALTHMGTFWEEATKNATGATRHKVQAGKCSPDLSMGQNLMECKSVGKSRRLLVFKDQLDRYGELDNYSTFYLLFMHDTKFENPYHTISLAELRLNLASNLQRVVIVSHAQVATAMADAKWNLRTFYHSGGSGRTFQRYLAPLPVSRLLPDVYESTMPFDMIAFGQHIPGVPVVNLSGESFGPF